MRQSGREEGWGKKTEKDRERQKQADKEGVAHCVCSGCERQTEVGGGGGESAAGVCSRCVREREREGPLTCLNLPWTPKLPLFSENIREVSMVAPGLGIAIPVKFTSGLNKQEIDCTTKNAYSELIIQTWVWSSVR